MLKLGRVIYFYIAKMIPIDFSKIEWSDRMTRLIDDVFKNQKFIPELMSEFGFQKTKDTYTAEYGKKS